jgi:hypothetical protein
MKNQITDLPENDTDTKETKKSENNNAGFQILTKLEANDTSRELSYFAVYTFQ